MEQWSRPVVVLAFAVCVSPALAQTETVPAGAVRPVRFEETPIIDGHIDEAVWTKCSAHQRFSTGPARHACEHPAWRDE